MGKLVGQQAGRTWARFHALDTRLCVQCNRASRIRLVRWMFRLVSRLGDGLFWVAVMAGILLAEQARGVWPVLHMLLAGGLGTLFYKVIKGKALRSRPFEVHQVIQLTGVPLDRFSFPSGHTLHAVAFSTVALAYYPQLTWLLLPFTVLVALSRVILGLHYPSDVLAGAALGFAIAATVLGL